MTDVRAIEILWLVAATFGVFGIYLWARRLFAHLRRVANPVWEELGRPQGLEDLDFAARRRWKRLLTDREFSDVDDSRLTRELDAYRRCVASLQWFIVITSGPILYLAWPF